MYFLNKKLSDKEVLKCTLCPVFKKKKLSNGVVNVMWKDWVFVPRVSKLVLKVKHPLLGVSWKIPWYSAKRTFYEPPWGLYKRMFTNTQVSQLL